VRLSPAKLLTMTGTLASLIVMGGCGGGEPDLDNGRDAFIAQCAECHILADARSGGRIGPDLDAAFAAARAAGMNDKTIEGIVASQIESPRYTDPEDPTYMPGKLVVGEDLRDVSAYVAAVAGNPEVAALSGDGDPGEQVFIEQGCAACHSFAAAQAGGRVGPNLDTSLLGQTAAQVRESIVRPNETIAEGYPAGVMPEVYGSDIDEESLEQLVDYLVENTTQVSEPETDTGFDGSSSEGGDKKPKSSGAKKRKQPKS
jgi:mono/diheme cytochrome c family protein